jgi:GWxTD domain-containing protein
MMRTLAIAVALLLVSIQASGSETSLADSLSNDLQTARQHLDAKRFTEATKILEAALPKTDALPADMKAQARTAMHFYAAVAYSALDREDDAIAHLEEALRLTPSMRNIDPKKYSARFVTLFNRARSAIEGSETFDKFYPGYSGFQAPAERLADVWQTPALTILGTKEEKRAWQALRTPEERARFIAEFWRIRDESPETAANEFRDTFGRRVAFVDKMFGTPGHSGALTDRGRVFALLGEPAMVQRRAINNNDSITIMNYASRGIEVGTIEFWFYTRDQLPSAFAKPNMTFRFVTHQGVGQHVLQTNGLVMNALAMASTPQKRE